MRCPYPAPQVASLDVDGEIILFEPDEHRAHLLSATASIIWPFLDGRTSLAELADDVTEAFGVDASVALADIEQFVAQMVERGFLIVDSDVGRTP